MNRLFFFLFSLFLVACGDDDEASGGGDNNFFDDYFISFNVSGSESGSYEGYSDVYQEGEILIIFGTDDPTLIAQTFSLKFIQNESNENGLNLQTGVYDIEDIDINGTGYSVLFENISTGAKYGRNGAQGSINITEVTDMYIEGTFNFTAPSLDNPNEESISVSSGAFKSLINY